MKQCPDYEGVKSSFSIQVRKDAVQNMATRVPTSEVVTYFMENTSAHGIRKLSERTSWCTRLIWLLLLVGAACLIAFQLWQLVALYLRRPVTTKTTITSHALDFPSVTLCNLNPFKYSLIRQQKYTTEYIQNLANSLNVSLAQFGGTLPTLAADAVTEKKNFSVSEFLYHAPDEFRVDALVYLGGKSDLFEVAQPPEELIVGCMFAGKECSYRNFTQYYDMDYLTCYQFPYSKVNNNQNNDDGTNIDNIDDGINTDESNITNTDVAENNDSSNNNESLSLPPQVFTAGQMFGLSLILNVDQEEYLPFVTPSAGIRVAIHEYGTRPNLMQKGQSVPPGFESSIGIRPVTRIQLPEPHGNCEKHTEYSDIQQCQRICLEDNIEGVCGCTRRLDNQNNITYNCGSSDIACVKSVISATQEGNLTCLDCKIPCRSHSYLQSLSMTYWPSDNFDPALKAVLKKSLNDTRGNLLSLKIYISELTEERVVDEPAYEWENLVSDIGGQLGLWLGISVLSICEIIELFCILLRNCCKGRANTTKVRDIQKSKT